MAKVVVGMTISLDGFVNDLSGSVAPLYPDHASFRESEPLQETIQKTGAVVMARMLLQWRKTRIGTLIITNSRSQYLWLPIRFPTNIQRKLTNYRSHSSLTVVKALSNRRNQPQATKRLRLLGVQVPCVNVLRQAWPMNSTLTSYLFCFVAAFGSLKILAFHRFNWKDWMW